MKKKFNTNLADSQATKVVPVSPENFDFNAYSDYENSLRERCKNFMDVDTGVLVYRRMRVAEVFTYGCRDMEKSLAWQLGALKSSMVFKADVPNFLEPWYGIGTVASSFGVDYVWPEGQAPVVNPQFQNVEEALQYPFVPVEETNIGGHTLRMIEYFMDKTKGQLPLSFTDSQSPLNIATELIPVDNFLMDLYMNPDAVMQFLDRIADLIVEFYNKQEKIIGECLVKPGHGFASSRYFNGNGFSDDMIHMLSPDLYESYVRPSLVKAGNPFGGPVFHSCGNWTKFLDVVKSIPGLLTVDGAFSEETDPEPNDNKAFSDAFAGSGIVLNARIVGDLTTIEETVTELWQPGIKLMVVTYCESSEDQEKAYKSIRQICKS